MVLTDVCRHIARLFFSLVDQRVEISFGICRFYSNISIYHNVDNDNDDDEGEDEEEKKNTDTVERNNADSQRNTFFLVR